MIVKPSISYPLYLVIVLFVLTIDQLGSRSIHRGRGVVSAFTSHRRSFWIARTKYAFQKTSTAPKNQLWMRDASASYWFEVGDSVKVVEDVYKSNMNLKDRIGKVIETWEKCDVDPTCCCAEQVDINMAVRVEFTSLSEEESYYHYFGEAELVKLPVAFDGMTCTAFKLDRLKQED